MIVLTMVRISYNRYCITEANLQVELVMIGVINSKHREIFSSGSLLPDNVTQMIYFSLITLGTREKYYEGRSPFRL